MESVRSRTHFIFLCLVFTLFSVFAMGCTEKKQVESSPSGQQQASDTEEQIPTVEDDLVEYETVFDDEDSEITEVYEEDDGDADLIMDAEGETTIEVEIPQEDE